ncbi:PDZ domain-containing protein, partial [bacterium]|nr:PDZ domain-containing protein [bacterium]
PKFEVKPYMGFDAQDLLPDVAEHLKLEAKIGVLVTDVRPGSPAAVAGMAKNDVIRSFGGLEIKDFKDLKKSFVGKKPGDTVDVVVIRGKKKVELKVKLGAKKVRVG